MEHNEHNNNQKERKKSAKERKKQTEVTYADDGELAPDLVVPDPSSLIPWDSLVAGPSNQVIGTGVTSSIYSMKWNRKIDDGTTVAEDVAVKVFDLSHAKDRKQNVWSWNHEDRLYTSIGENENLVKYYGRGIKNNNTIFLVFELANVGFLWNLIALRRRDNRKLKSQQPTPLHDEVFPDLDWLHIIHDIAKGMRFLSESSIIHRDLTVKNILVFRNPQGRYQAKVADLGLANFVHSDESILRGSTRHYAPESAQSKEKGSYTSKSDVYMFANVLHEIGHGRDIFRTYPTLTVRDLVVKGERPEFEVVYRDDVKTLMRNCWHADPKQRPSFFDVCYTLEQLIEKISNEQNEK
jgi:serine/threonine protein kinase